MKTNVQQIFKALGLPDKFTRIDMEPSQINLIRPFLTPFLEDCHNNSPTVKRFLELSEQYSAVLQCYIVNSDRDDTRFSIEGSYFTELDRDNLMKLVAEFRDADELDIEGDELRVWWD